MIRLFLFMFLLRSTFGGKCSTDDFSQFNKCITTSLSELQTDSKKNQLQQKVHQCLVQGKCVQDGEAPNDEDSTIFNFFGNVDPDTFLRCQNNVTTPLIANIEQCVQKTYDGFTMMNLGDLNGQQLSGSTDLMKKFMHSLSRCDSQNLPTVLRCAKTASAGANSSFSIFCNNAKTCVSSLSCNYGADVKPVVCQCTREHLNSTTGSASIYEDSFFDCLGLKRPNLRRKLHLTIFINELVNELCDNDICSKLSGMK